MKGYYVPHPVLGMFLILSHLIFMRIYTRNGIEEVAAVNNQIKDMTNYQFSQAND